jgi:YfiH family protein
MTTWNWVTATTTSTFRRSCAEGARTAGSVHAAAVPAGWHALGDGFVRPVAGGRVARLRVTGRQDGDLALRSDPATLARNRRRIHPGRWTWLRQVHGARVVVVHGPGDAAGEAADAAVTTATGAVLAVHSADCAVVGFWSPEGVIGAAHAGWRGLRAGVLERTVEAMVAQGATSVQALLGPSIEAACYQFGADDLASVAQVLGPDVVGRTSDGHPALDLAAGVRAALARTALTEVDTEDGVGVGVGVSVGVSIDDSQWCCTACSPQHYSHRARRDTGRSALVIALRAGEPAG